MSYEEKLPKDFTDEDWSEFWDNVRDKKEQLDDLGILSDTILVIVDDDGKFIELVNDSNGYVVYHKDSIELKKVQKLLGEI